jgi:hypothetical protein
MFFAKQYSYLFEQTITRQTCPERPAKPGDCSYIFNCRLGQYSCLSEQTITRQTCRTSRQSQAISYLNDPGSYHPCDLMVNRRDLRVHFLFSKHQP